jgi:hypothetical protein
MAKEFAWDRISIKESQMIEVSDKVREEKADHIKRFT